MVLFIVAGLVLVLVLGWLACVVTGAHVHRECAECVDRLGGCSACRCSVCHADGRK